MGRRRQNSVAPGRVLVAMGLVAALTAVSAEDRQWRAVRGNDLGALFSEREFGDGVHFAYQFRMDGGFTGTEMGRRVTGKWKTTSTRLCWSWTKPPGGEECYDVQRNGNDVRLMSNGSEAFIGKMSVAPSNFGK
jgi:hypothetical protein